MRRDLRTISIQNVDLGTGDVIFWQLANLLKQARPPLVIKIFRWKRTWTAGKPGNNVGKKIRRL